jgi:hypothetical protein
VAGNSAVVTNLAVAQGTDKTFSDSVYQADGVTPQDTTGWTAQFTVHQVGDPRAVYVTKTVTCAAGAATPQLTWTLAAADTAGMFPGEYYWRVEKTNAGADDVISAGFFTVLAK